MFCLFGCFCFWFVFFFLMGPLTGLCTGPLPALLWLSTSRQPCMEFQFIFLLRLNVCNDLAEAMKALDGKKKSALVEDSDRLISEITAILESKQAHPLLDQMVNPDVRDDMPIADFTAAASSRGFGPPVPHKQKHHNLGFSSVS